MAKTTFSGPVQSLGGFLDAQGDAVGSDAGGLEFDRAYYDERFIKQVTDPLDANMLNPLYSQAFAKELPAVSGISAYTQGNLASMAEPLQGATFQYVGALGTSQALSLVPHLDEPSASGEGAIRWGSTTFNENAETTCKWKILSPYTYTDSSVAGSLEKSAFYAGLKGTNTITIAAQAPANQAEAYFFYAGANSRVNLFDGSSLNDPTKLHFIATDNDFAYIAQLPITVEKRTAYDLEIKFDSDRKCSAFVNGVQYNVNSTGNGQIQAVTKGTGKSITFPGDSLMRPVAGFAVDDIEDPSNYAHQMSVISVAASVKTPSVPGLV